MEEIYNSINYSSNKNCVALGNFDGVHLGHRHIIKTTVDYALTNNLTPCIYTFKEHPSCFLGQRKPIITDNVEKTEIFRSLGCDSICYEDFLLVRNMSPEEFCKKILSEKLNAAYVFCGENYRFGYQGKGDINILKYELENLNIKLIVVPYVYSEDDIPISSTEIRKMIQNGDVFGASRILGRYYRISGQVLHGKHLGRKLGFPTLNIRFPEKKVIPKHGVYLSKCLLDGKLYNAISNIGLRPTTDSFETSLPNANCETFLLDYSGDAYGKNITVNLIEMLRTEMKFETVEQLKEQIMKDVATANTIFSNIRTEINNEN